MALSRATRVNLLIGTAHFLSHFYVLCLPPLFLAWQQSFHVTYAELGMIVAAMSGTTAILQTPVGFLVDRYGARPFLVGGTLIMSLAIAAMGLATEYWQLLVLAVVSGIGNSVIHPADYAILSGSIDREHVGRAFAFHTFNGNLGFMAGPPVIAALSFLLGWREAMILVGLLGLPCVGAILLQSRVLSDQPVERDSALVGGPTGRALLFTRPMLLFFAFFMLSAMASAGLQSWLITALNQVHGIDLAAAASILTAYMAGATFGTLVGGWFADKFRAHVLPFALILTTITAGLLLVVDALAMPVVLTGAVMVVAGLALGASRTPRDVMVKEASPPGQIGKVFGFISAGLPLGQAITPAPFGYLIDRGHPELVLVVAAAILMLSLLCAGSARSAAQSPAPAPIAA
jgi:FSR family fosmidomycin resistance protein-like MFS transporter